MSELLRKEVPLGIATFIIAVLFVDYYIKTELTSVLSAVISDWSPIIIAMATGVGLINVIKRTYYVANKREPYWHLDVWMIIMMIITIATGLIGTFGTHPIFSWMMSTLYIPITQSVFGMVFFSIISAFYRSFRARTKEAAVLLVSGILVMLKNAPITSALFPGFLIIPNWLMDIPNTATSQAVLMVTGIGTIGYAIRLMLRQESPIVGVID